MSDTLGMPSHLASGAPLQVASDPQTIDCPDPAPTVSSDPPPSGSGLDQAVNPPLDPGLDQALDPALAAKLARAQATLAGVARLGVAYSGGVDSAVLLAIAVRTLGPANTLGILGVSPSLAADERRAAHETAALIGTRIVEAPTREGDRTAYRANGPDRCFHCKDELFTVTAALAAEHGLTAIAYGENADDIVRPDRPGSRAATEHGVLRPLAAAGMTKADVRALASAWGMSCADKPAAPCLASRIPHFSEVTPEKLAQVEAAEAALRSLGFADSRVRHHGEVARVELLDADLARAVASPVRELVLGAVRAAGFRFVALDLGGIQSGAFTLPLVGVTHGR